MTTWIHRMIKVGEGDEYEIIYIPDEEFMLNWQEGDPAGYRDKQRFKDWSVLKVKIPEELNPDEGDETGRIRLTVDGNHVFLADVLANGKYGRPTIKIGEKEWELKSMLGKE